MAYEDSPSVDNFEQGIPEKLPDPEEKRRSLRKAFFVLGSIVILLGIVNFAKSSTMAKIRGTGTVQGMVVNDVDEPLRAEIIIPGTGLTAHTDAAGRFEIKGVQAGKRSVVIVYSGSAWEYPVQVPKGAVVDMGKLKFMTTVVPEE